MNVFFSFFLNSLLKPERKKPIQLVLEGESMQLSSRFSLVSLSEWGRWLRLDQTSFALFTGQTPMEIVPCL